MEVIRKLVTEYTDLGSSGYDEVLHARAVAKSGALKGEILINGSSQKQHSHSLLNDRELDLQGLSYVQGGLYGSRGME